MPWRPALPKAGLSRGTECAPMAPLDGKGIQGKVIGDEAGRASGLKMCYAGRNKGTRTLHRAELLSGFSYAMNQPDSP